ncbi:amino acid adenylation domain-containing protein [Streptomyces sp. B6B3]|uniref:amino acid adenylation domain-containing protein n=1 Tax=Streptomyces sp. B6B3 TaxID=3153570 RepID=UPI00325D7D27
MNAARVKGSGLAGVWPLSPLQEGMLFHASYDDQGPDLYGVQWVLGIDGRLDAARLRASWEALLRRHAALRVSFHRRKSGDAVQLVKREATLPWREVDLSDLADSDRPVRAAELAAEEAAERLDLAVAPLIRLVLIRLGAERHHLVVTTHHIVVDGWSKPLLFNELSAIYAAGGDAQDLPAAPSYENYLAWLGRQDRETARSAWRAELDGVAEPTLVAPLDRARIPVRPVEHSVELSEETTAALSALARRSDLTVNTLVQGAWALVLARLARRNDVVFGATVAGRPTDLPGAESTVGLFINTVPVRVRVDGRQPVMEMLTRLQERQSALTSHQYLGLADIQKLTDVDDLFDTIVVYQNSPRAEAADSPSLSFSIVEENQGTNFPLALGVLPEERLTLAMSYRPDLFDEDFVRALTRRVAWVLEQVVADPSLPVARIDVASADERSQVIGRWNDTDAPVSPDTWLAAFDAQTQRSPAATALRCGPQALTYAELEGRANQLARHLDELGVGPEIRVGLCLPRGIDMIVAMLAVWKAGGAFVPLDPDHPTDRLAHILTDSEATLVLGTADTLTHLPNTTPHTVRLNVSAHRATVEAEPNTPPARSPRPAQLAYVIYTSGSTGRPKGVAVTHQGLTNLAHAMRPALGVDVGVTALQFASFTFDAAILDITTTLATGATLAIATTEQRTDPQALAEMIRDAGVTVASVVPSLLTALEPESVPGVTTWVLGAERLTADLASRWAGQAQIRNTYGPTEATVITTVAPTPISRTITPHDPPPAIGQPLANTRVYLLDTLLRPVPPGITGEMYLAGPGLARGYTGQPALTAERFIACPFPSTPGERIYRTGDLAHWDTHGHLHFDGRTDTQTKIHGHRIEPGEIETTLTTHDTISQAVVVAREDRPGDRRLVAYLVPYNRAQIDTTAIRDFAATRLPSYMLPTAMTVLDALPLTPNGKIDHRALPAPDLTERPTGRAPRTEAETILCALFGEILRLDNVSAQDSFFELGGDSIMSMQLATRARREGLTLTPRQIFREQTPERLALAAAPPENARPDAIEDTGVGEAPFTPAMRAMGPHATRAGFTQGVTIGVPAALDQTALTTALGTLQDTHHVLRARIAHHAGQPSLVIPVRGDTDAARLVTRLDATHASSQEVDRIAERAAREAAELLDPAAGTVLRAVWVDAGPQRLGRLVLTAHHLVIDGVSWRILLPDLAAAYQAAATGRQPALDPEGTTFKRWADLLVSQAHTPARVAELDAWTAIVDHPQPLLGSRPLNPSRDTARTMATRSWTVPAEQAAILTSRTTTEFHCGVHEVLLATLTGALARWRPDTTANGLLVDIESHGRHPLDESDDLSRTVGWFTSVHPTRLSAASIDINDALAGGPAAGQLLKTVKEQLRATPDDGLGYGMLRHLNPDTAPTLAALATPDISFNYLGRFPTPTDTDTTTPWQLTSSTAIGSSAHPDTPTSHTLDASALVQDTPQGPQLHLTLNWAFGPLSDTDAHHLGHIWLDALTALATHTTNPDAGGHTPSDFPLLDLTQDDVDELELDGSDDLV